MRSGMPRPARGVEERDDRVGAILPVVFPGELEGAGGGEGPIHEARLLGEVSGIFSLNNLS